MLPAGEHGDHYWAYENWNFLAVIETIFDLYNNLRDTKYDFEIEEYYKVLFYEFRDFLRDSGGSELPPNHVKITLVCVDTLFSMVDWVQVSTLEFEFHEEIKLVLLRYIITEINNLSI